MSDQKPRTLEEIKRDLSADDEELKKLYWNEVIARVGGQTAEAMRLYAAFCAIVNKAQVETFAKLDAVEALTVAAQKAFDVIQEAMTAGDIAVAQRLAAEWLRVYGPTIRPTV